MIVNTMEGKNGLGKPTFNRTRMLPFIPAYRHATHVHFVELIKDKPAWTLIIRFKYIRWWGFWNKGIFTVFNEYFDKNRC